MTRCVIYCRVSTDAQEREGTSLDTQEAACRTYAAEKGWTVVEVCRDTASGFTLERISLDRVRALAGTDGVAVVLAHALDRLSRKQTHVAILVEEMEEAGIELDFVTEHFEDTAVGQLVRSVKAFAAEFEREKIAERTMRGKLERAKAGKLPQGTGKGCYGYIYHRETGQREIQPDQGVVVLRLFTEFAGGASIMGLTNALNAEGITTFTGKRWSAATIFHMLQNPVYAGRTWYRRTKRERRGRSARPREEWREIEGATPPIVEQALFDAVQARLGDPERLRHGHRLHRYDLAGHIRCQTCEASMVGQTLRRTNGDYRYYRCRRAFAGPKHDRCPSRYVRANELEAAVRDAVTEVLADPAIVLRELERLADQDATGRDTAKERARLDEQRRRLRKLYELGEVDDAELESELSRIKQALAALDTATPPIAMPTPDELDVLVEQVRGWVLEHEDELPLIADALQLEVYADRERAEVRGVIPDYAPSCNHADVCAVVITSFSGDERGASDSASRSRSARGCRPSGLLALTP